MNISTMFLLLRNSSDCCLFAFASLPHMSINAGYLVTEVMDIVENGLSVLVLDASAACHMPDVLEMPYRPPLRDSGKAGEKKKDKTILPERFW